MSAFRKCVDAVLGAFLLGVGAKEGLKAIQDGKNPLPRIAGGGSGSGEV